MALTTGAGQDELDLYEGTYVAGDGRGKTNVVRVGVLWPRTIAVLRKLTRTVGTVFKSTHGAAFMPGSFRTLFRELRTTAGVPEAVQFNMLRDGAYSAACREDIPLHLVQILAGHSQSAETDHYIARQPKMVLPAVKAIEEAYFD